MKYLEKTVSLLPSNHSLQQGLNMDYLTGLTNHANSKGEKILHHTRL